MRFFFFFIICPVVLNYALVIGELQLMMRKVIFATNLVIER